MPTLWVWWVFKTGTMVASGAFLRFLFGSLCGDQTKDGQTVGRDCLKDHVSGFVIADKPGHQYLRGTVIPEPHDIHGINTTIGLDLCT